MSTQCFRRTWSGREKSESEDAWNYARPTGHQLRECESIA